MKRLLVPSTALLWGLQVSFLNPALGLILVSLYGASTAEVGWVLSIYNVSGFVASLIVPGLADRRHDYLRPLLGCGVLTMVLAGLLAVVTTLPLAVVVLVVVGGPAGTGFSLLFAHLRHSGARPADLVNTRAIISFAWVAGPPVATFVIGALGTRAVLVTIGVVAALGTVSVAFLTATERDRLTAEEKPTGPDDTVALSRTVVVLIMAAFVLLQAANATVTSIVTIYATQTLHLSVVWGGVSLGVAAGLEIPALLLIGRLSNRYSSLGLIATGCVAGVAYYGGMAAVTGPVALVALQVLNAWLVAAVSGVGITLFQQMIPRPGLAAGLYSNTRRIGAVISGPLIALGSLTRLADRGIFVGCAVLTALALLVMVAIGGRAGRPAPPARP